MSAAGEGDSPAGSDPSPRPSLGARLRPYLPLLLVALAAFGLRLALLETVRPECREVEQAVQAGDCFLFSGDTQYVAVQAEQLRAGHGFVEAGRVMYGVGGPDRPGAAHPPLYTLLLAGLQSVGVTTVTGWRVAVSLIGSIGVFLLGLAGWRLGAGRDATTGERSRRIGIAAAVIAAVNPLLWSRDVDMFVEALVVPLIALFVLAMLALWRRPTWGRAAVVGLVVGVAWLTRSEQILLLVFAAPVFLWGPKELPVPKRVGLLAAAGAVAFALMLPWLAYNNGRFHRPVLLSTNGGMALLLGNCDHTYVGEDFAYYTFACVDEVPVDPDGDDSDYEAVRSRAAIDYARDHTRRLPLVAAARLGRFWRVYAVGDTVEREALAEGHGWIASWGGLAALYLLAPLAVAGTVSLRRRRVPISPLLAPILVATLAAVVLIPIPRFRTPADGAVVVLAAVGVDAAWRWWRGRGSPAGADGSSDASGEAPDEPAPPVGAPVPA